MHHYRHDYDENTCAWDCSSLGFWLAHLLGGMVIFYMGVRFAFKRAPLLTVLLYRLLRGRRQLKKMF